MDGPRQRARSRSFGDVAETYDATRPGYPADAVGWLTGGRPARIVDLAAGTGLLTEPLVAAGHQVLAIEPAAPMIRLLAERVPGTPAVQAVAEALPLTRRCTDVLVVGQAFHWFDTGAALAEAARVLRPGGTLGLIWNYRDSSVPWVGRLSALLRADGKLEERTATELVAAVDETGLFTPMEQRAFRSWQPIDRDQLLGLVRSRSYIATLDRTDRQGVLDRVGQLYDTTAPPSGGLLMLPYVCRCYRARLRRLPRPPGAGSPGIGSPGIGSPGTGSPGTGHQTPGRSPRIGMPDSRA